MPDERCIKDRIDSFISNPEAVTLTGQRRMGTGPLLDMLADRLDEQQTNIIRIKGIESPLDQVREGMRNEAINHVLIYDEIGTEELQRIAEEFPDVHIYRAQGLCHQLPACVKVIRSSL